MAWPSDAVLDERILLSEGTQVDALAEVVHVLEVLAPAGVDDLEDDEALDVARNVGAPELLLLAVELERLVAEVLEQRLAADLAEVFLELLDGEVRVGEVVERLDEPRRDPTPRSPRPRCAGR